ncbi:Response regulator receiver:Metal-dependent phosphohydrolase, HD subdomain protein [Shewanella piezotolerans WP3]|uniref:Response regulator receiver:Metal-dependent phosphohydrolase, HD subdomain protein n=1 Tax=Shewanella piezotolerans (strain WP3 / JCM 13877) TaxID=225849 RepID=B8CTI4_SHEPW|nr:HD domain-containing phosphohydrolase [Shewanella piezotolerans]ACJ31093.1 Response regulator receiver:Metal-dependent phosphohydrolase, HD subdomain protein [Shewanella piezotolerans WP3]
MDKATILVVDDTPENIDILVGILSSDYKIRVAIDGPKALALAQKSTPDIILLDVMMPGMNGYEVCERLKQDPLTCHIPVIFVTALAETADETQGFALGAVDYITKPVSAPVVQARVKTHLALYDQKRLLEQQVKERTKELEETRFEIIRRLGRAAEYKDNETGLHVVRMSLYARLLAIQSGLPDKYCELIYNAAPMHDIGKIGTPDSILKKPAKLDEPEWDEMQRHAEIGAEIIGDHHDPLLEMARRIALSHHEKWDGSGYPFGVSGQDIPIEGRIVAIADVFDALTSIRPYKKAWTVADTMALIESESGKHFDPELVEHFKQIVDEVTKIRDKHHET